MRGRVNIVAAAALAVSLGVPAAAETIGYADAVQLLTAACGKNIDTRCSKVRLGSGRIEACLQEHASQGLSNKTFDLGIDTRAGLKTLTTRRRSPLQERSTS
jgi:hypothetical protein